MSCRGAVLPENVDACLMLFFPVNEIVDLSSHRQDRKPTWYDQKNATATLAVWKPNDVGSRASGVGGFAIADISTLQDAIPFRRCRVVFDSKKPNPVELTELIKREWEEAFQDSKEVEEGAAVPKKWLLQEIWMLARKEMLLQYKRTASVVGTSSVSSSDPGTSPFFISEVNGDLKKKESPVSQEHRHGDE
ncbi:hypothetical protein C5167_036115 [Papaver somniferum]|nr:hypothetical protein C5167_036115 [Papaver somniferum]